MGSQEDMILTIPDLKGPDGEPMRAIPIFMVVRTPPDDKSLTTLIRLLPDHPGEIGIIIADVIRHFGNAFAQSGGPSREEVVLLIKRYLDMEFASPTDPVEGEMQES